MISVERAARFTRSILMILQGGVARVNRDEKIKYLNNLNIMKEEIELKSIELDLLQ